MDGRQLRLSHAEARELRDALTEATTRRRRFVRTAGEHRPDGTYVVERATADSAGHRKVFDRFADVRRLYTRLPAEFTASDVDRVADGLSGNRRHLLVRHFAEHPAFDCELTSRQPLTVRKTGDEAAVGETVVGATDTETPVTDDRRPTAVPDGGDEGVVTDD